MSNKENLLFSTKISQNTGSDMIGGSIAQILFADFYQSIFGYRVSLHDPFFNVEHLLDHKFDEVLKIIKNINHYDRIANCQFYFGNYWYKNRIKIDIERGDFINKYIPIKQSSLNTFRDHEMYLKQENIHYKFLDIPYVYQYDLMYKLRYRPSFKPIKKIFETDKNVYGVHIRQSHWKNIETRAEDNIIEFYVNLFKKINSRNGLIIYYGSFNEALDDEIKKFNTINGNLYSEYPLERALLLSRVNHSITSINGFSLFSNYLALASNNLKNIFIVNDIEKISELTHLRRVYSKGLLENNIGNSGMHARFKVFPGYSVLKYDLKFENNEFLDFHQSQRLKPRYIFFESKYLKCPILSFKLDNILIEKVYFDASSNALDVCYFDMNDVRESDLYVLTHYNYPAKENKILGSGSLDFNKPFILNKMMDVGPDQLRFEDILDYLYRSAIKKPQPVARADNIAFISGYCINNPPAVNWTKIFNYFFRFLVVDKDFNRIVNFFKRKIFNYQIKNDFNPLNQKDNFFSKLKTYAAAEIELKSISDIKAFVKIILKNHDRVICEPSRLSLVFSALDEDNKVILYTENFENYDLKKSIFEDAKVYKISDFFPIHFHSASELKIHLKSLKINR